MNTFPWEQAASLVAVQYALLRASVPSDQRYDLDAFVTRKTLTHTSKIEEQTREWMEGTYK